MGNLLVMIKVFRFANGNQGLRECFGTITRKLSLVTLSRRVNGLCCTEVQRYEAQCCSVNGKLHETLVENGTDYAIVLPSVEKLPRDIRKVL